VYYKIVEGVFEYCREKHIPFCYRPHPKEKKHFYEPLVKKGMQLSKQSLVEDLEGNLVIMGGKTTVILEAGLYGDVAIQILWEKERVGDFLFDNAYVLEPNINCVVEAVSGAIDGKLQPKVVEASSPMLSDLKNVTKAAIEKNIRQYEGRE